VCIDVYRAHATCFNNYATSVYDRSTFLPLKHVERGTLQPMNDINNLIQYTPCQSIKQRRKGWLIRWRISLVAAGRKRSDRCTTTLYGALNRWEVRFGHFLQHQTSRVMR